MNYRHAFHAGNFADVFKHVILIRILGHLCEKPQAYRVIDTHAGAGLYDLAGAFANRTGEWRDGIGKLFPREEKKGDPLLERYLDVIAAHNLTGELRSYPGSPLIALAMMRPQDRLTACELEPHAAAALSRRLKNDKRAKVITIDGFTALNAYVPPVERRGLVLIDPPFEEQDEFDRVLMALERACRKWPGGTYLLWYPVKDAAASRFVRQARRLGIEKMLRVELHLAPPDARRLTACGLLVVNPPWRLPDELKELMAEMVRRLGQSRASRSIIES